MKPERGDAIFILYLESKLVLSRAELPRSLLSSSLLSTRDKAGKKTHRPAKATSTTDITDSLGRKGS